MLSSRKGLDISHAKPDFYLWILQDKLWNANYSSVFADFLGTAKPQTQDDMRCHWRGVSTLFYNPAHMKHLCE
ncbi:hypothetical protein AV530_015142 [Patagioenas fasciata monilis]|uniref:Uncharacterized protein n=1 Tax=Patagioenas fasciata monilis TaxID=372326 RepID=A0A1V4K2P6_PATFA|nr:hypothetical protein AV530_015142 [Patagioenas fasciata monilis]